MCFPADPIQLELPLLEVCQEDHLLTPFSLSIDHQALPEAAHLEHHLEDHLEDPKEDFLEDLAADL